MVFIPDVSWSIGSSWLDLHGKHSGHMMAGIDGLFLSLLSSVNSLCLDWTVTTMMVSVI